MFTAHAEDFLTNQVFILKMGLILAAGVNAALLHTGAFRYVATWDTGVMPPPSVRVAAALSIVLWIVRHRLRPLACLYLNREGTRMPLRPGITLDQMNHRGDGRLPGLMGFRVTALEDGMLRAGAGHPSGLLAPNGYLHAATVIALADTACGYGCIAHLAGGRRELHDGRAEKPTSSARRAKARSRQVARPVHLGNSTQVWDAVVTRKADGKQMALFRCTQLVLWPK